MSNMIGFSGKFKLVASKADGSGERVLADWFDNLIVNSGLNTLGEQTNFMDSCSVGSGSSVPAVTNTALDASFAGSTARTGESGASSGTPWYCWYRFKYRFAAGVAAGNVSEIGIFTDGTLWSRALVKDAQGNTTTITVLSDEVLDVYYEIRIYPPDTDAVGNFTLDGVTHTATIRSANASNASWVQNFFTGVASNQITAVLSNGTNLGPITGSFGVGTATQSVTLYAANMSWYNYTQNSMQRRVRMTLGLDQCNFSGGVGGMNIYMPYGQYQVKFDPPLPKTDQKVIRLDFIVAWARRNNA